MSAKWRTIVAIAALVLGVVATAQPVSAQSGGSGGSSGCGSTFAGATTSDSDGDGVSDAAEVVAGTDDCNPDDTPTLVCGEFVANYDLSTADTDSDGFTDAAELAAGSDHCDSTSVIAAAVTTTTAAPAATTTTAAPAATTTTAAPAATTTTAAPAATTTTEASVVGAGALDNEDVDPPQLALTGPSTATLAAVVGVAALLLGLASLAVGRRVREI